MNILYAVRVYVIEDEKIKTSEMLKNWHVDANIVLENFLESAKTPTGDTKTIIVSVDNTHAKDVVEKALVYFETKLKAKRENMLVKEISYLGEGA